MVLKENMEFEKWEKQVKQHDESLDEIKYNEGYNIDECRSSKKKKKSKKNKEKKKKSHKKKSHKKKSHKKKSPKKDKAPDSFLSKKTREYKRLQKDNDSTVISKPKSEFKDASEITFEEKPVKVDETRNPGSLVFIGHVDTGKSTI
jgi:septum formation inhibitor MinC